MFSAFTPQSDPRRTHNHTLLSNLRLRSPYLHSPGNTPAQLDPQALGSLFVACYDWQGYCGDILSRLHAVGGLSLVLLV
jgi:hypothetical protein